MRLRPFAALLLCAAGSLPAVAAVESSAPDGFVVRHEITVPVDHKRAFAEVIHPERWWNDKHTWSGSAANLSLDARAGGCWCEKWDKGEAEHAVVTRLLHDDSLRLRAAFGPLQAMAVNGVFDIALHAADGGVRIAVTYRVTGPASAALDKLAAPVDGVIGEQVQRLKARLEAMPEVSAAPAATTLATALAVDGFGVVDAVLDAAGCAALVAAVGHHADGFAPRRWLDCDAVAALASHLTTLAALADVVPRDAVALQCTLFDKSPGREWSVGPHQDLSMPAATLPVDIAAPLPRTVEDGLEFVQPPPRLLESLLAVRVQLDATADRSGALEVFPGTHRRGRLTDADLQALDPRLRRRIDVPRGGALVMRPLLVHTSRRMHALHGSDDTRDHSPRNPPGESAARRRVLHFLFAPGPVRHCAFAKEPRPS